MQYTTEKLISGETKIMIHSVTGNVTNMHSHDFIEFAYVKGGSAIHHIAGKEIPIKKGDYFIIDCHAEHGYSPDKKKETLELVHCLFFPEILDGALSNCKSFNELLNCYLIRFNRYQLREIPTEYVFHDSDGKILSLLYRIDQESEEKQAGHVELARCYLIELLVLTLRKIYTPAKVIHNEVVAKIVDFADKNFSSNISLDKICGEINYSLSYISRKFKEETGTNFNKYVQRKRIEQACHLLVTTLKPVMEIAQETGYCDYKFFLKVFKENIKVSPREFRKIHR